MTNQQIFDRSVQHLLTQNKRSLSSNGWCAYRGNDNLKCAAGEFIADEHYDPSLEGKPCANSAVSRAICDSNPTLHKGDIQLLFNLQHVHDASEPAEWPEQLEILAQQYDLPRPALLMDRLSRAK